MRSRDRNGFFESLDFVCIIVLAKIKNQEKESVKEILKLLEETLHSFEKLQREKKENFEILLWSDYYRKKYLNPFI